MNLWLDSDGVMCDFDNGARAIIGTTPNEIGDEAFWPMVEKHATFWSDLPVMDGAFEFWEKIKHHNPTVLTGAPKTGYDLAEKGKREWWRRHFSWENVIVCRSKDKQTNVTSEMDILIDDRGYIIKRWIKAGGTGILFKDFNQAYQELRSIP